MLSHRLFLVALTALIAAKAACLLTPVRLVQLDVTNELSVGRSRFLSHNSNDDTDLISSKKRFRFDRLLMRRGNSSPSKQLKKKITVGGVDVTVTNILIAINIAVFLAVKKYPYLAQKYMKVDRLIARGQTYRLFSSVFLHQALYHVGANSYSLYNLGQMAEKTFGSARFLSTYLFAGIFANIATYAFKSSPASLGASGCTFGLIGAFATYYYRNRLIFGKAQSNAALSNIKRTVFINLMYGFAMPNVDNGAHIGGFLAGAMFAYLFGPRLSVVTNKGRRGVTDKPLIPYTKYWKTLTKSASGASDMAVSKTVALQSAASKNDDVDYRNDIYSDDGDGSEFNSDSSGMKRGG
mmetsp:Transcript_26362/g.25230  ORF Transcript_26362/g.25230 Transcript_26362/m.25230 type:complete len:352 (-) Transcript_26362:463-1518(-)|eukprot:CAMPEP_0119034334 /NCGR_PEP_ID=MMETSP1177-20130426/1324_1 /TAXON_ID=2985 /ORGANISM="Ochromonas sp, Strain CCMP1899" /LENGTH=351 /DNA_ID=CAMNT_0006991693 /DNA_START=131 /DNA_END=1186 /DNA_ORIENTATION=+